MAGTVTVDWSAAQYARFECERLRPIRDLLGALPPVLARAAIDLGCGPGNSTEALAARFPDAALCGIDLSRDMLDAARRRLPRCEFVLEDIGTWAYRTAAVDARLFDVIFANAALQWLPEHERLFPALAAKLQPGGALAVQMPDNLDEPAHRLMRDLAANGPWAGKLAAAGHSRGRIEPPDVYYELLRKAGCTVDVWRTTYYHVLPGGADAIVEWFKGSGLRPYLAPLAAAERALFLERYRGAVAGAYPVTRDGSSLLPLPRLFLVAHR